MEPVDLAVVGGGVIGAMIAHEAVAAFPGLTVAVLERGLIGQGASSRSAGVHFPRGATERVRAMSAHSERVWLRLAAELDLPIREVDATVAGSADKVTGTYLRLGEQTAAETWTLHGCHYADVQGVAGRVLASVRDRVTVLEGNEVAELSFDGEHQRLVFTNGSELLARRVVLAPGPWIGHSAWADLVAPLGLRVKKVVAAHLESSPAAGDQLRIFHDEDAFVLPLHGRGHFLFSYTCNRWDVTPDGGLALEREDLDDARAVLGRFAPELVASCDSGRVFCDAYSPNREPVVAELRPGLVFAGAANGSGYRLAPAIAAETVALLNLTRTLAETGQRS